MIPTRQIRDAFLHPAPTAPALDLATPATPPPPPDARDKVVTLPDIPPPPRLPGGGGSGDGKQPPPSAPRRNVSVWVGTSTAGEDFVVLRHGEHVYRVWHKSGAERFTAISEALAQAGGSTGVRVVLDVSTGPGRLLASAVTDQTQALVIDAMPGRETFVELGEVLAQARVVYYLSELGKLARLSRIHAARVAAELAPAFDVMAAPSPRPASIPQTPMPPPWRRPSVVLFGVACLLLGVLGTYLLRRLGLSVGVSLGR